MISISLDDLAQLRNSQGVLHIILSNHFPWPLLVCIQLSAKAVN